MSANPMQRPGPPYAPTTAGLGGRPTVDLDIPICAVLIALFVGGAASHMTIFQMNRKRGHKFIPSVLVFGFCMSRIVALVLRLAWATKPTNVSISIAANIFLNAGILIIYIINNLLMQRILRSSLPSIFWNPFVRYTWKALLWLVLPFILMVIVCVILTFYTLDRYTLNACRIVLLIGLTYILVVAAIPLVLLPLLPFVSPSHNEFFGSGSWTAKRLIVTTTTILAVIEAGFRTGVQWSPARPASDPAWYDGKAAFYCFNFMIDILVVYFLLIIRFDKRFWVPNGSSKSRTYALGSAAKDVDTSSSTVHMEKGYEGV